jgi:2-polyprenyl-3-methyl-5-hydroxy-6-metoxy-1,4-benzoquinol methylase
VRPACAAVAALLAGLACEERPARGPVRQVSQADYDRWRRPEALIAALELRPGDAVVDLGAGRGYLTRRLAAAVGPRGRVVATDIDPDLIAALGRLEPVADGAPIEARLVTPDRPGLEPGRYDLVLMAEVDHLVPDRRAYLAQLRPALSARGRVAVSNRIYHRASLLAAARDAGYSVVADRTAELPGQFLVLLAPDAQPAVK